MIGIIIPTEQESQYIKRIEGIKYLVSGAGKVNATIAAMDMILNSGCSSILCVGTCGALDDTKIGTIISPRYFCEHDMDCSTLGYQYGVCLNEKLMHIASSPWKYNASKIVKHVNCLATGDYIVKSKKDSIFIREYFGANYVDMESYAIAKVCNKYGVPFNTIRSVTDNNSNQGDWLTNIEIAMTNLNEALFEIFDEV